MILIESFESWL